MNRPDLRLADSPAPEPATPSSGQNGDGGNGTQARLARLEVRMEYVATKKDVRDIISNNLAVFKENLATKADTEKIKVWFLTSVIAWGILIFFAALTLILRVWN